MSTPRTIIEFVDVVNSDNPLAHKVKEIRVNGTAVLLAEYGVDIEYGFNEVTAVTLRILPSEVHFISKKPEE